MTQGVVFEGSEKKLEIAFQLPNGESLRFLPREFWASVVIASGAQILSELSNLHCDAYLLSESSLFVFKDRIVMITCGRTRLIEAAKKLVKKIGIESVESFFYERKNEAFPEAQLTSFDEDVRVLKRYFPQGESHTVSYPAQLGLVSGFIRLFQWGKVTMPKEEAYTVELLMHGIDSRVMNQLKDTSKLNREKWSQTLSFNSIFPGYQIDEFWFEPCGYSLNGINKGEYFSIHITPEKEASYVSLEFNRHYQDEAEFKRAIQTVLSVFKPQSSLLVQFNHENESLFHGEWTHPEYQVSAPEIIHCHSNVKFSFQAITQTLLSDPAYINLRKNKKSVWIQHHQI